MRPADLLGEVLQRVERRDDVELSVFPAAALSVEQAERVPRPSAVTAVMAAVDMSRRRTFMTVIFN
ncbi:hypothetical protein SALBM311S_04334 [Streptomyces alboniger]